MENVTNLNGAWQLTSNENPAKLMKNGSLREIQWSKFLFQYSKVCFLEYFLLFYFILF